MKPDKEDQTLWALWAADCAERVLPCFETQCPDDERPRNAVEAGRAWARGQISCGEARAAALAARAAARAAADDLAACAAVRAAARAAATAHVAGHARHAAAYAVKAVTHAADTTDAEAAAAKERAWQVRRLPAHLRSVV